MHQLASSVLSIFLSPFNWILFLIIGGYFIRKIFWKKFCYLMSLIIFLLFSNPFLLNWYATKWQPAPVEINRTQVYSCGIVPGGFASPDADGNGYFNASADRFIQAEKLYKVGVIKHILISGGNGKDIKKTFREGRWVKNELITTGIPDSVIFYEDRSNNTADNARFAKNMLDSLKLKPPFLLVTSAQHIPRASVIFKNAGLTIVPFPCNYMNGRGPFNFSSLWPSPSVLSAWNSYLKEAAGYFWYKFSGR